MKKFLLPLFLLSFPSFLFSQANSVTLKDGGGNPISNHASIGDAYAVIPGTLTQGYIIEITPAYTGSAETYPITFVAKTGASLTNTITLRPALGVTSYTIQSNIASNAILVLDNADYVIIDGRAGGVGNTRALSFNNLATGSNANTINLINGATFNQIKYCNVLNSTTTNAGRAIFLGASASNPTGNSDNKIEYCHFPSGRYKVNSNGTAANPNTRNLVRGSSFENMIFVGFWGQAGTGKLHIDSCSFYCTTPSGSGAFAILFDSQNDTTIISNNRIYDMQGTGTTIGINIRSTLATGTNLTFIYNNFISFTSGNSANITLTAILYEGANQTTAKIIHNTVRMGGTLASGGTSGNVGSAAFVKTASNVSNSFEIRNNIFVNERSGGNAGLQHLAMSLSNVNGTFSGDHNTYVSTSGNLTRLGTVVFTDIPTYQAAAAPNEANSNNSPVLFTSNTDLHLTGASVGNSLLTGTPYPGITTDIDGDFRTITPYRGADEAIPLVIGCSGVPVPGTAVPNANSVCSGAAFTVNIVGLNPGAIPELSFQWQSSTNGINYSNIIGQTSISLNTSITQQTYFRAIVTCTTSGLSDTSGVATVSIVPNATVASISQTHNVGQYNFSAVGAQNVTGYAWAFGDGNFSSAIAPTHNYTASGNYNVQLIVSNACSSDTTNLQISVGCEGTPTGGTISGAPNIACPGQMFTLNLTGFSPLITPTLTYQWQSSNDGTNFFDIPNQTSNSLTTSITANTTFRLVITCTASGLSANSNHLLVNFLPLPSISSISETHNAGTYQFTANGLQNATSTLWNFGNGASTTTSNPSYTYTAGGNYTVSVVAINACGMDTASISISVGCDGAPAVANINASQDSACVGDAILFSLAGLDAAQAVFYSYQWQRSTNGTNFTNIPNATSPTLNIAVGNEPYFRCVVTCQSTNMSNTSQAKYVEIGTPINSGNIIEQHTGLSYNFSINGVSGNYTVVWNFGDGNTASSNTVQHTYANNGNYLVSATVSNGCDSETFILNLSITVGINDLSSYSNNIIVFPNPTQDVFAIDVEENENLVIQKLTIHDISGRILWNDYNFSLPHSISSKSIHLTAGTYIIELQSDDKKWIQRLIVQ